MSKTPNPSGWAELIKKFDASALAFMLKNRLEDVCPVVFVAQRSEDTGESFFKVAKYLGNNLNSATPTAFKLNTGKTAFQIDHSELPAIPEVDYDNLTIEKNTTSSLKSGSPLASVSTAKPAPSQPEPADSSINRVENVRDPITFSSVIEF